MKNSFQFSLLLLYIIFSTINAVQTISKGYLLGVTFEIEKVVNKRYKIDSLTGEFTVFSLLENYVPLDITYDFGKKIIYVFADKTDVIREETTQLVILVNPFNVTKHYRTIFQEDLNELYGLHVDMIQANYIHCKTGAEENSVSIVQIDPHNFIVKTWFDISDVDGISPDSKAIFYNSTHHQYFVTLVSGLNDVLVGVALKN